MNQLTLGRAPSRLQVQRGRREIDVLTAALDVLHRVAPTDAPATKAEGCSMLDLCLTLTSLVDAKPVRVLDTRLILDWSALGDCAMNTGPRGGLIGYD